MLEKVRNNTRIRIGVLATIVASLALIGVTTAGGEVVPQPAHAPVAVRNQTGPSNPPAGPPDVSVSSEDVADGNASNIVQVENTTNNRFLLRGRIQVNHIPGLTVTPLNEAIAYASCTDCDTFAVALQFDLYNPAANDVAPENIAVAYNYQCDHCTTVACAYQVALPTSDVSRLPDNANGLANAINHELENISRDPHATAKQAEARLNAVVDQFDHLTHTVQTKCGEQDSPAAAAPASSPSSTPATGPAANPAGTAAPVASGGSASPAATTAAQPTAPATDSPTLTRSPSPTPTPQPSP